eukprot:GHVQ01039870.1.p1 GENE.GHVQ01039870.1~~GHVQ01039870.1.p1  ORF type:complete len:249 (-),score=30.58 GHVQ01039870.1:190-936(-)
MSCQLSISVRLSTVLIIYCFACTYSRGLCSSIASSQESMAAMAHDEHPLPRSSHKLSSTPAASAIPDATVEGFLVHMPDSATSRCFVTLNGGQYQTTPNRDGSFFFNGVAVGQYILEVHHPHFAFRPLFVECSLRQSVVTTTAYMHTIEHGRGQKVFYPLQIAAAATHHYFQVREEFNILALVRNPMILIGLVGMGLMLLLPKLQNSIDPEALQELGQGAPGGGGGDSGEAASKFVQSLVNRAPTRTS